MNKIKLQIKSRFTGSILFEYESENNTIKETVVNAVKSGADLRGAYLSGADLRGADLGGADLRGADLGGADLRGADLGGADLRGADLRGADLGGADLGGADLRGADLGGADLRGADLGGADLGGADLRGADLGGADLGKGKVKTFAVFTGIYRYIVIPYILKDGEPRVKMGCHDRSVVDWDTDFWNNNDEFPNNGSIKSNLRVIAYDTAKKWIELNK
jgi:hypothetical protein